MILQKNISLKQYSNYKIGGSASYFLEVKSIGDVKKGLSEFYKESVNKNLDLPVFIMGSGTNILIDDRGYNGLVIKNEITFIKKTGGIVNAGAGTLISDLVNFCIENSLSGLEWAGGLPGTIGGAIRGNAGAFKGETKDSISKVRSVVLKTFEEKEKNNAQCEFGYRTSVYKTSAGGEMIVSAEFKLTKGEKEKIRSETQEKIDYRIARHPLEYPNIGSTFKNILLKNVSEEVQEEFRQSIKNDPFPILPAAKLLATAALKGTKIGDAMISDKHPNFIVNLGNASSGDVRALIDIARKTIKDKYDVVLEEEILVL